MTFAQALLPWRGSEADSFIGGDPMNPGFEEFERRGLESTLGTIVRTRIVLLLVLAGFSTWLGIVDPAPWRRALLAGLLISLAVLDVYTRRKFLRVGFEPSSVHRNLVGMVLLQGGLIFATGGLAGPLFPVMLPPAFAAGVLMGRRGIRRLVLTVQVPLVLGFVLLHLSHALPTFVPEPFVVEGGPTTSSVLLGGFVVATLLVTFGILGAQVRTTAQRHLGRLASAQEAALATHRQRIDELTTLGGEIAHELKNPLASVKGLAQLLSRTSADADDKTRERLEVLEREVVRMQGVLEEFLNFSRPLTPLSIDEVNVDELCRSVRTLHEAMAAEHNLNIDLSMQPGLQVRGDPRKIAQVVINLLQNAIEASSTSGRVTIDARAAGDDVQIRVLDEGEGMTEPLAARLFEPGVTSKATGNGLGLTVARAIADQHGGSLTLSTRSEGGCVAVLTLPRNGPTKEAPT